MQTEPRSFTTLIVGQNHYDGASAIIAEFTGGEQLVLTHEPENPYDSNAVAVYSGGIKLGHIPARDASQVLAILNGGDFISTTVAEEPRANRPSIFVNYTVPIQEAEEGINEN